MKKISNKPLPLFDWMESQTAVAVTAVVEAEETTIPACDYYRDYYDASHPAAVALREAEMNDGRADWNPPICDPDMSSKAGMSRLFSFPLEIKWRSDGPHLLLRHPGLADLSFVKRVEAMTGLQAKWEETFRDDLERAQLEHANYTANDSGCEGLLQTLHLTSPEAVRKMVERNLEMTAEMGKKVYPPFKLSNENAAKILASVGMNKKAA